MTEHEEIRQWLLKTVRLIADHPDDVRIEVATVEERTMFRIKANPGDVGKVIGRQGRTSQFLRVSRGRNGKKKLQWRFVVDIETAHIAIPTSVNHACRALGRHQAYSAMHQP
jgi:predicted RNA-binding protein YlqC (UPF0109 family)